MDQKSKTILLIIVALAVWGYSALEWLSYYETGNQSTKANNTVLIAPTKLITIQKKEDIILNLNYRDPFLTKQNAKKSNHHNYIVPTQNKGSRTIPKTKSIKENLKWPKIKYAGTINGLGLLNIDKKDYIVKVNNLIKNLTVKFITKDSITVLYKGIERSIKK